MNNLVTTTTTQPTMSSLELVDIINDVREQSGKPKILHKNLLQKVESHPGIHSAEFSAEYKDSTGRTLKMYNLPKRECDLLVMSESLALQAQVYDRLTEEMHKRVKSAQTLALQNDPTYKLGLLVKNTINPEATNRLGLAIPWAGQPPQKQKMTKALKEFLQTPRRQLTEIEFGIIVNMLARA